MAWPHRAEVAMVERGELRLPQPLCHGQDRAVYEADFEVGVGPHQLGGALVIRSRQVLDYERAGLHLVKNGAEGFVPGVPPEQMVNLDQHRGREDATLPKRRKQRRAGVVMVVVVIERRDDNASVEDQRNGSGSKTSSLASLLRSPRPELNAPMQVRGGCSPSSSVRRDFAVNSANSCSSASRTSCGTATPRSSATWRARSSSSASTSTVFVGDAAIPGFYRRCGALDENRGPSSEPTAELIAAMRPRDRATLGLAVYAGLRLSELLALDIAAVDLDGGWIHVHRSWDRGSKQFVPTKSRKPRSVPIIDRLAVLLADHFVLLNHPSDGLLFPSTNNPDWPTDAGILRRRTHARWKNLGLKPLGFHEGRHTYASIAIAAGLNAKTLSTYLGHATITITLDRYGHLMPGSEVEARALLDVYLDG